MANVCNKRPFFKRGVYKMESNPRVWRICPECKEEFISREKSKKTICTDCMRKDYNRTYSKKHYSNNIKIL